MEKEEKRIVVLHCDDQELILRGTRLLLEIQLIAHEKASINLESILISQPSDLDRVISTARKYIAEGSGLILITDFSMGIVTGEDVIKRFSFEGLQLDASIIHSDDAQNVETIAKTLNAEFIRKGGLTNIFELSALVNTMIQKILNTQK